jgi:hypothetical protein
MLQATPERGARMTSIDAVIALSGASFFTLTCGITSPERQIFLLLSP